MLKVKRCALAMTFLVVVGISCGGESAKTEGGATPAVTEALSPQIASTATGPRYADMAGINGGRLVREVAQAYCGGAGRIGDFARILGLPRQTRNLDRIARKYGTSRAGYLNRGDLEKSPTRAEILWATYRGCLAGLRMKNAS